MALASGSHRLSHAFRAALSLAHPPFPFQPLCSSSSPDDAERSGDDPPKPQAAGEFESWLGPSLQEGLKPPSDRGGDAARPSGRWSSPSSGGEQAAARAGRPWRPDTGFDDSIFSVSASTSKATRTASGGTTTLGSFLKASKDGEKTSGRTWEFLKDQSSTTSSYRSLGDSGFGFLKEAPDAPAAVTRPAEQDTRPAEQDTEEENILQSASFQLLRDSFKQPSLKPYRKPVDAASGSESGSLLDTWTKPVDSRTLAEVEGGKFYSATDPAPQKEVKEWSYEELGEKLRQVRPPEEQLLASATGLSFGELRDRLVRIEHLEAESLVTDALMGYKELTDSLNELRQSASPKSLSARKQLSRQDLVFLNTVGSSTGPRSKIEYIPPKDDLLTKYYSQEQLSSKELLKLQIDKLKKEFQIHESDSGSSPVQIAILTAKINNLNRHLREGPNYKRDKHSRKGLNDMVQYRKRLLRYLRRRDWDAYCNVLTKLHLDDVILEKRSSGF